MTHTLSAWLGHLEHVYYSDETKYSTEISRIHRFSRDLGARSIRIGLIDIYLDAMYVEDLEFAVRVPGVTPQ